MKGVSRDGPMMIMTCWTVTAIGQRNCVRLARRLGSGAGAGCNPQHRARDLGKPRALPGQDWQESGCHRFFPECGLCELSLRW